MRGSVRKRGKRWYYYYYAKVDGKRKKIEKVGGDTRQEALKSLNKALYELDEKKQITKKDYITFEKLSKEWLEEYSKINCRETTYLKSRVILKKYVLPRIGHYKLYELTSNIGQRFANDLHHNCTREYAVKMLQQTKQILKYAIHPKGYIDSNPFEYVTMPRQINPKKEKNKLLTIDDINKLLKYYVPFEDYMYTAILIALYTGMRRGEIYALKWKEVDLEKGIIKVKYGASRLEKGYEITSPKTVSSIRDIPISEKLLEYLNKLKEVQKEKKTEYDKYYDDNDFVVKRSDGTRPLPSTISTNIRDYSKKRNKRITLHMLRHTHATLLVKSGATITDVQNRLGHSRPETTLNIYTHSTEEGQKEMVELFDESIKGVEL